MPDTRIDSRVKAATQRSLSAASRTDCRDRLLRSCCISVPITVVLLLPAICTAQYGNLRLDRAILVDRREKEKPPDEQKLWDELLLRAGKPRSGVILESRFVSSAGPEGQSVELVVSVKNVCMCTADMGGCESWPVRGCARSRQHWDTCLDL